MMEGLKDGSHLYEVEHQAQHAARPGFRINKLRISPTQKVPWHYHSNVTACSGRRATTSCHWNFELGKLGEPFRN